MDLISHLTRGLNHVYECIKQPIRLYQNIHKLQGVCDTSESLASLAVGILSYYSTRLMSYSLGDFFSPDLVVWVESGEEASLEAGVGAIIEVAIKITDYERAAKCCWFSQYRSSRRQ